MSTYTNYFGIDISKETFDVVNKEGKHFQFSNDTKGFVKFVRIITKGSICVMEVTGIYHLNLAKYLYSKNIPTAVVNPLRIKRFSQMLLRRNKTDKADARMICLYAQDQQVDLWKPAPKVIEQSKDIYQTMEQYIEFKAGLKNKLDALKVKKAASFLIDSVTNQIKVMSESINALQNELDNLVKIYNPVMLQNITSIVGIGQRTGMRNL